MSGRLRAASMIKPGTDTYGLYQGFLFVFAFLVSVKNQFPIIIAATRTAAYLMRLSKLNPSMGVTT